MKGLLLICCIAILALVGLSCTPETTLEVAVTEVDDGVVIENVGGVDSIVFVKSPDGEQQFELAIGERVRVTGISKDAEVSAVGG